MTKPEQPRGRHRTDLITPEKRGDEVADGPEHHNGGAARDAAVDLFKMAEQPAVSARGETGEIVGPLVDLLHEGRLRIDHAVRDQDTMNLGDDLRGRQDMLQDGLDPDAVDRTRS